MTGWDEEIAVLRRWGADLVLDVGANTGQTGQALRRHGYTGRIVSFEPLRECFEILVRAAAEDPLWEAHNLALGDRNGEAQIGVSENRVSSSILPASEALVAIHAPVRYERSETIRLARLDGLFGHVVPPDARVHLKIDTQGFEAAVIAGAEGVLPRIATVRMEVAVGEVYEGETVLPDMIARMDRLGYVLIGGWPAWRHPQTQEVLHFDLLFRRRALSAPQAG